MARQRKRDILSIFVDTETERGFEGAAITCQWSYELNGEYNSGQIRVGYDCWQRFADWLESINETLKNPSIKIFIHNAGFDCLRIRSQLPAATIKYFMTQSKIILGIMIYKNVNAKIIDSYNILPSSLKKLAQSFTTGSKLDIGDNVNEFDIDNDSHLQYALNDVEILHQILLEYSKLSDTKIEHLRLTAPSQALNDFKKLYQSIYKKPWYGADKEVNADIRENFYFGGRVIIKNGYDTRQCYLTTSLDITSSYPASMIDSFFPDSGVTPKKMSVNTDFSKLKGRWLARIRVFNYFDEPAIFPYKHIDGTLFYPHGSFDSVISDTEFYYAINKNPELKYQFNGGYYVDSKKTKKIFSQYIAKYYAMKKSGDELNLINPGHGDGLREIGKLRQNSLYGKFAQTYDSSQPIIIGPHPELFDDEPESDSFDHRNSMIAALITAESRVRLYEGIDFYGPENVVYCDTDSMKVEHDIYVSRGIMSNENDDLGGWKNEGMNRLLHIHAPKVYSYYDEKNSVKIKAKGLPIEKNSVLYGDGKTYPMPQNIDKLRHFMLYNVNCFIRYGSKPVKIKTHYKTGKIFDRPIKSLTDRNKVSGYEYKNFKYFIKNENNIEPGIKQRNFKNSNNFNRERVREFFRIRKL